MNRRAWLELTTLALLWGAVYSLSVVALRDLPPVVVVFFRVLLGAAVTLPLALRRHAFRQLWRRPRAVIETVLIQLTLPLLLLTYGQQYVDAGLAGIIVGAQPVLLALLAIPFAPDQRPRTWRAVVGIVIGFLGLALLFGFDLGGGTQAFIGGFLVLLSALGYAGGAIMAHRRHSDSDPMGLAVSAMLVSAAVLAIPAALSLPDHAPGTAATVSLVLLGTLCTGGALALYYVLISSIGPALSALSFYLSPGFAVVIGVVFLGEQVHLAALIGLLAIIAGSVLAAGSADRRDGEPSMREAKFFRQSRKSRTRVSLKGPFV
jgi:drug/metabolite transporter (DMT)-like permease